MRIASPDHVLNDSTTMTLSTLQSVLLKTLHDHIDAQGRLHDPLLGDETPKNHYAPCAVALAFATEQQKVNWTQVMLPIRYWQNIPIRQRGHFPFNRLLLNLLVHISELKSAHPQVQKQLQGVLKTCPQKKHYISNNWSLLAQANRVLEASTHLSRQKQVRTYCTMLDHWQTKLGGFIDFPETPMMHQPIAVPLTYHHKALFLTALLARLCPHEDLLRRLCILHDWLVHCWDPAGYAGGIGRSTHALFGDACLIGTRLLLGECDDSEPGAITALAQRIGRQQREDGWLWLDPNGPKEQNQCWDRYMHLSVYNAWFAAIIGACKTIGPIPREERTTNKIAWRAALPGTFHDEQAGILHIRDNNGASALISTCGQLPQSFSRYEVELRYAGGQVITAQQPSGQRYNTEACRIHQSALLENPGAITSIPLLLFQNQLYGCVYFPDAFIEKTDDMITVYLNGYAQALTRPAQQNWLQRIYAALDWRFFDGKMGQREVFQRKTLPTVRCRKTIYIVPHNASFKIETSIEMDKIADKVTLLNPNCLHIDCHCNTSTSGFCPPEQQTKESPML